MDEISCSYYTPCPRDINNWVLGDTVITWLTNALIILVVVVAIWGVVALVRHFRRPLCVDCLNKDKRTHTRYRYKGDPVCTHHHEERTIAAEKIYRCPKHGAPMKKVRDDVILDRCSHGCVFLDDGELDTIREKARSSGQTTGMAIGMVID